VKQQRAARDLSENVIKTMKVVDIAGDNEVVGKGPKQTHSPKSTGIRTVRKLNMTFYSCFLSVFFIVRVVRLGMHRVTKCQMEKLRLQALQALYAQKYDGMKNSRKDHGYKTGFKATSNMNKALKKHLLKSRDALRQARAGKSVNRSEISSDLSFRHKFARNGGQTAQKSAENVASPSPKHKLANFLPVIKNSEGNLRIADDEGSLSNQDRTCIALKAINHQDREMKKEDALPVLNLHVEFLDEPLRHNIAVQFSKEYQSQSHDSSKLKNFVKTSIPVMAEEHWFPLHSEANLYPSFKSQMSQEAQEFSDRTTRELNRIVGANSTFYTKKRKFLFHSNNTTIPSDLLSTLARETSKEIIQQTFKLRVTSNLRWIQDFERRLHECIPEGKTMPRNVIYALELLQPCFQRDRLNLEGLHAILSCFYEEQLLDLDVQFVLFHTCHCFGVSKEALSAILRAKYRVPTVLLDAADKKRLLEYNYMSPGKVDRDRRRRHDEASRNFHFHFEHLLTNSIAGPAGGAHVKVLAPHKPVVPPPSGTTVSVSRSHRRSTVAERVQTRESLCHEE